MTNQSWRDGEPLGEFMGRRDRSALEHERDRLRAEVTRLKEEQVSLVGSLGDAQAEVERLRETAAGSAGEIDALIDEVLDTWTWPITDYRQMRPWMVRLIDANHKARDAAGTPLGSDEDGAA